MLTRATSWSSLSTEARNELFSERSNEATRFNERCNPIVEADDVWEANHQNTPVRPEGNSQVARSVLIVKFDDTESNALTYEGVTRPIYHLSIST